MEEQYGDSASPSLATLELLPYGDRVDTMEHKDAFMEVFCGETNSSDSLDALSIAFADVAAGYISDGHKEVEDEVTLVSPPRTRGFYKKRSEVQKGFQIRSISFLLL